MSEVVSKIGVHCIGPRRDGYGEFLRTINSSGRRLSVVKVRDDFGAVDEPLQYWPDVLTIGAKTEWDDAGYSVDEAYNRIVEAARLNPKIKYWEYLNERNGDYQQQADLYIALIPRLALAGLRLCLFNCASGTPQYPDVDDEAYRQIKRVCKFVVDNGYDALLGLHEYESGGAGTIGRYAVLADYLADFRALIPIVITEYGFETSPGDAAYLDFLTTHDYLYMVDPRVVGCATWTLGGGGWAASNYQGILPQLGEYIAMVEPVAPPPVEEFVFSHWLVDGVTVTAYPLEIVMDTNHDVVKVMRREVDPVEMHTLTVSVSPEGSGSVTVTPADLVYIAGTRVKVE